MRIFGSESATTFSDSLHHFPKYADVIKTKNTNHFQKNVPSLGVNKFCVFQNSVDNKENARNIINATIIT